MNLYSRIGNLEWSRVYVSPTFPYDQVPQSDGQTLWDRQPTVAVDGTTLEVWQRISELEVDRWIAQGERVHVGLNPYRSAAAPMLVMATADTKLSFVRRVVKAFERFTSVQLIVRPHGIEGPAWSPAKQREAMYERVAREAHDATRQQLLRDALLSSAAGCPEAVGVFGVRDLSADERLQRLANAFEACRCTGDMETMAALYWWKTFGHSRAARWLPWDPAVAAQLGDDATYEQLVHALSVREASSQP